MIPHHQQQRENTHGCEVDCLLARTTEAVERDARGLNGPACIESGHTCNVHGVIAAAGATTHDDVVYFCWFETDTVSKAIQYLSKDALWVHVVQSARLFALASW